MGKRDELLIAFLLLAVATATGTFAWVERGSALGVTLGLMAALVGLCGTLAIRGPALWALGGVVKPAIRFSTFRVVIALHLVAVLIFGVLAELDMHGMLTTKTAGTVVDTVAFLVIYAAYFAIFICPGAVLVLALRRGWSQETVLALVAESVLIIGHAFAITISCQ
jgi:hypothetical protein